MLKENNNLPKDVYKNWLFGEKTMTRKRSEKKMFPKENPGKISDLAFGKQNTRSTTGRESSRTRSAMEIYNRSVRVTTDAHKESLDNPLRSRNIPADLNLSYNSSKGKVVSKTTSQFELKFDPYGQSDLLQPPQKKQYSYQKEKIQYQSKIFSPEKGNKDQLHKRKASTSATARKNVSSFSLNAEKEIMMISNQKPLKPSKKNMETKVSIEPHKPIKKLFAQPTIDPILGSGIKVTRSPTHKKFTGQLSNRESSEQVKTIKVRSHSRGNMNGLLIFPQQPSNYAKIEKHSLIIPYNRSKSRKSPPKDAQIFAVSMAPQDLEETQRIPFKAKMPGEHLNSLQYISSENIILKDESNSPGPRYVQNFGKGGGLKSSGKFNKSSYDLINESSPVVVETKKPVWKKGPAKKPQDLRQQFIEFIRQNEKKKLDLQADRGSSIVSKMTGDPQRASFDQKMEKRKQITSIAQKRAQQTMASAQTEKRKLQNPDNSYGNTFKFQAEASQRAKALKQKKMSLGSEIAGQILDKSSKKSQIKQNQLKDEQQNLENYNQMMTRIDQLNKQRQDQYRSFVQSEIQQAQSVREQKKSKDWEKREQAKIMSKLSASYQKNEIIQQKKQSIQNKAQTHRELTQQQKDRKLMQQIMKH